MVDKKCAKIAGWIGIATSVLMFLCSDARIEGEMNPLSFFVCCIPLIVGISCFAVSKEFE